MFKKVSILAIMIPIFSAFSFFLSNFLLAIFLEIYRIGSAILGSQKDVSEVVKTVEEQGKEAIGNDDIYTGLDSGATISWDFAIEQIKTFNLDFSTAFFYHEGYTLYYIVFLGFLGYVGVLKPIINFYFEVMNSKIETHNKNKLPHRNKKEEKRRRKNESKQGVDKYTNFTEKVMVVEEVTMPVKDDVLTISREQTEKGSGIEDIKEETPFNRTTPNRITKGKGKTTPTEQPQNTSKRTARNPQRNVQRNTEQKRQENSRPQRRPRG